MVDFQQSNSVSASTLLHRITDRIRRSLELPDILNATVTELRSLLETDRVKIYRFEPDGSGCVVAESLNPHHLPSLLGLYFPADDIPLAHRELFVKARQRSIVDIEAQSILLSRLDQSQTTSLTSNQVQQLAVEEILERPVDSCHVEYLTAMGVKSSLVVPILHQGQLWGLLVSHHAQSKQISHQNLQLVQLLADQVSIAITQSDLLNQTRQNAAQQALVNQVSSLLHAPLQIEEILQQVLEHITTALQAAGGRLYLTADQPPAVYTCGVQPVFNLNFALEETTFWQQLNHRPSTASPEIDWVALQTSQPPAFVQLCTIDDLYQVPELENLQQTFQTVAIRSLLVMPLNYGAQQLGYLTLFRTEIDTDIAWAGRFDSDARQDRVRSSFAMWREIKSGQTHPWTQQEQDWLKALGAHLIMAVMQHRLYRCEHEQRVLVEMRNHQLSQARRVAEEANRLKSDFLSSTSHELRTPLASILNYLKLLQEGLYDTETEHQEYINIAHQSAEMLVAILNDVLDLARIEAGRMPIEMELLSIAEVLTEAQRLFEIDSRKTGIALETICQVETVWADRVKVRQIITNLIANAFKFTEQGKITVYCCQRDGIAEITIADTGIGIDPSQRDHLFEPFVQADGSIKRRYGGTGLGLTICKRLVELMGGQIWIASRGVGHGTTVTFTLRCSEIPTLER
ncbi:ATP-binding protein [Leptolyngbya sp. AN03gr2]|uniref:ATP-binding protein n=1 Tax=unclassified Leptolyngbya TaxID=2650499 RepID=UPI003D317A76